MLKEKSSVECKQGMKGICMAVTALFFLPCFSLLRSCSLSLCFPSRTHCCNHTHTHCCSDPLLSHAAAGNHHWEEEEKHRDVSPYRLGHSSSCFAFYGLHTCSILHPNTYMYVHTHTHTPQSCNEVTGWSALVRLRCLSILLNACRAFFWQRANSSGCQDKNKWYVVSAWIQGQRNTGSARERKKNSYEPG